MSSHVRNIAWTFAPELAGRVIVADSWTAQSAQILDVYPDLVIASVPYQEKSVIEILKSGTRFLGLAPRTLDDVYRDISLIAGVVEAVDSGARGYRANEERNQSHLGTN